MVQQCFHDDYLPAFNQDNVTLLDTSGKGIESFYKKGIVVGGRQIDVDLIVLATGYKTPFEGSIFSRGSIEVRGRDGLRFDEKWENAVATLHGVCSNGFPNLFWPGLPQAAIDGNHTHSA
jgi:cation diffusion facilitator CzcD-associated flavoprotein CzcO